MPGSPITYFGTGDDAGDYSFLSNFYDSPLLLAGKWYPTAEHAYQAMKTEDREWQERIRMACGAGQAKKLGRQAPMRPGWDGDEPGTGMKDRAMLIILEQKFQDPELALKLQGTADRPLVEGNYWHDQYWGDCNCAQHDTQPGLNRLGISLMHVRGKLLEHGTSAPSAT